MIEPAMMILHRHRIVGRMPVVEVGDRGSRRVEELSRATCRLIATRTDRVSEGFRDVAERSGDWPNDRRE
jgi:hypothetical protein